MIELEIDFQGLDWRSISAFVSGNMLIMAQEVVDDASPDWTLLRNGVRDGYAPASFLERALDPTPRPSAEE